MGLGPLLRENATHLPISLTVLLLAALALLYAGVILPTIWSRHPDRRAAAHRTLGMLLRARPPRRSKR